MTDAGLKDLAPLTHLRTLDLKNTAVADAGLKDLAPLTQLQKLYLDITVVVAADAGVKKLKAALPMCEIRSMP